MYSVIVRSQRWDGTLEDLAGQLAPVIGLGAATVEGMLTRGPLMVEDTLTEPEATYLIRRLERMGIPADLADEDGNLLEETAPTRKALDADDASAPPAEPAAPDLDLSARLRQSLAAQKEKTRPLAPPAESDALSDVWGFGDDSDAEVSSPPMAATTDAELPPPTPQNTAPASGPAASAAQPPLDEEDSSNAWSMLFPDLGDEAQSAPPTMEIDPPPEDDPTQVGRPAYDGTPDEASAVKPTLPSFGEEPVESVASVRLFEEDDDEDGTIRRSEAPAGDPAPDPAADPEPTPPDRPREAEPEQAPIQPPSRGIQDQRRFEGDRLLHAFAAADESRPPYAPEGFDGRAPHSPPLAMALSILAPGAGQVYNGQEHLSLDYGARFMLVTPWVAGAKQARERAEKISTYYAPRPDEGNLLAAMRYMATWYLCVGAITVGLVWGGVVLVNQWTREPAPVHATKDVARSIDDARIEIREARIRGLDAISEKMDEFVGSTQSTMSDEERAQRLFLQGVKDCRSKRFPMCEEAMRRVLKLDATHPKAFRLQAWASMRRGGGTDPMPDIGDVPTLQEYELEQERERTKERDASSGP